MLILAVKEPAEKKQLWELVLFKANNKGACIRPLPHVYAFVCKGMFFCPIWPTFHMYPVKTSVTDTDAPLPSETIGEREFLSLFFF